jgi:hypothetical protein
MFRFSSHVIVYKHLMMAVYYRNLLHIMTAEGTGFRRARNVLPVEVRCHSGMKYFIEIWI